MFVGPGTEVYEGMIVGENSRSEDMDVNPDQGEEADQHAPVHRRRAGPAHPAPGCCALEQALEFCREDECVEVTPATVRHAQGPARGHRSGEVAQPRV